MNISLLELWPELGGSKLHKHGRQYRGNAFWRDGDGLNISIDPIENRWFDFVTRNGGGGLTLVELALNLRRSEALTWLEQHDFIKPLNENTKQARKAIQHEGQKIADYYSALKAALMEYRRALTDLQRILQPRYTQSEELANELFETAHKLHRLDETLDWLAETPTRDLLRAYRACRPSPIPHEGREFAAEIDRIASSLLEVKRAQ